VRHPIPSLAATSTVRRTAEAPALCPATGETSAGHPPPIAVNDYGYTRGQSREIDLRKQEVSI
jgi:hypothetical protein